MFIYLNKRINKVKNNLRSESGQVAVVIIFFVAICLIFYAVVLNIGRVSQTKTVTQIAANVGAGQMGSGMASYGQAILMETLGGDNEVCGWTGVFLAILAIIFLVIAGPGVLGLELFTFLLIVSIANLALQVAVIQPGITELWNKIITDNTSTRDQFVEVGIQAGLQGAVTDEVRVPDMHDLDLDRIYGYGGDAFVDDEIARFAIYYNERVKELKPPTSADLSEFIDALDDFLFKEDNTALWNWDDTIQTPAGGSPGEWGLFDELPGTAGHECTYHWTDNIDPPSQCNICCQPDGLEGLTEETTFYLPPGCDCVYDGTCIGTEDTEVGRSERDPPGPPGYQTCTDYGPYGLSTDPVFLGGATTFKYVYEPAYEDMENNGGLTPTLSFKEVLGYDDEHKLYKKNPDFPNSQQDPLSSTETPEFLVQDTTSFWGFQIKDFKPGIFPFFYKVADWGLDLTDLDFSSPTFDEDNLCFWCDANYPGSPANCNLYAPPPQQPPALSLPNDPATLLADQTYCVNNINESSGGSTMPLAADKVGLTGTGIMENILANDNVCAQDIDDDGVLIDGQGFWKRGADRFCNPDGDSLNGGDFPYYANCLKHGSFGACTELNEEGDLIPVGCDCDTVDPSFSPPDKWPEDPIDDIIYGLVDFYNEAIQWIKEDPDVIADNLEDWYDDISEWIEIQGPAPDPLLSTDICYTCDEERAGWLRIMHDWIKEMKTRLYALRDGPYEGQPFDDVAGCEEVWCTPPGGLSVPNYYLINECYNITPEEKATFDVLSDGVRDFEDVVECLKWNAEDENTFTITDPPSTGPVIIGPPIVIGGGGGPVASTTDITVKGNAEKFKACSDYCTLDACSNLPRSMITYSPVPTSDLAKFNPEAFEKTFPLPGYDPANEPQLQQFLSCLWECSDANCQSVPTTKMSGGGDYGFIVDWTTFDENVDCVAAAFPSNTVMPRDTGVQNWYTELLDAIAQINPACDDRVAGGIYWMSKVRQSYQEALNQVEKFKQRYQFLEERLDELDDMIGYLEAADKAFYEFLTCDEDPLTGERGPACELTELMLNLEDEESGLPFQAVYGWRSEPPEGRDTGYWHIVKAEARVPGKCDKACGPSQGVRASSYPWPKVKSKTKSLGLKKCYKLINTEGSVKMRVIRFDENRDTNLLSFPNGEPIWDFKFFHPEAGLPLTANNLDAECDHIPDPAVGVPGGIKDIYAGAFIMSERKETGGPDDNTLCWDRVHGLLTGAVVSETCARYFLRSGNQNAMGVKFVDCKPF